MLDCISLSLAAALATIATGALYNNTNAAEDVHSGTRGFDLASTLKVNHFVSVMEASGIQDGLDSIGVETDADSPARLAEMRAAIDVEVSSEAYNIGFESAVNGEWTRYGLASYVSMLNVFEEQVLTPIANLGRFELLSLSLSIAAAQDDVGMSESHFIGLSNIPDNIRLTSVIEAIDGPRVLTEQEQHMKAEGDVMPSP